MLAIFLQGGCKTYRDKLVKAKNGESEARTCLDVTGL